MIICKKCGNRNEDRDQFCGSCGSFLEWSGEKVAEKAPEPAPQPAPPPPPPPPPPPVSSFDRLKERVGMEAGQAAPQPTTGAWVAPPSVAQTSVPVPGSPSARRPDAPAPAPEAPRARQPEEMPVAPPPPPRIVPAIVPDVDEVGPYCSNCGVRNDVRRHFCRRCGAPLTKAATNQMPWWQRLFPRRDVTAGDRPFRQSETSFGSLLRTFLLTMLVVVLLGGILAYLAVPAFRQAVNREVDIAVTDLRRLINPSYIQVRPVTTTVSSETTGHPGSLATNLINNDYWAADMSRDPQPQLTVTFSGTTDLDAIVVTNGAAGPDYQQLARPKTLEITYSDGTGEQVTLKDTPQATAYIIHARQVSSMTVRIISVYPGGGSTSVGLAEIEFRRLA